MRLPSYQGHAYPQTVHHRGSPRRGATAGSVVAEEEATPNYTFNDDFDGPAGSAPDPAKWTYDLGAGGDGGTLSWKPTPTAGPTLASTAKATSSSPQRKSTACTSAPRLKTQGRFSQIGGHFEARIKLAPGNGVCGPRSGF